jgi:antitoxin ParD1/3/4
MGKNTSISLGDHFEDFVEKEVSSGRYSTASEVIRAGLRLLENEKLKLEILREALVEGEKSGFDPNFDSHSFLDSLKKKHAKV